MAMYLIHWSLWVTKLEKSKQCKQEVIVYLHYTKYI